MASVVQIAAPDAVRRIQKVQAITIAWMSVEAVISLFSAWRAHNPALLAFGGDSAVELVSAVVVLWRFRVASAHERAEKLAARIAGALLFALAAYVALASAMSLRDTANPSPPCWGLPSWSSSRPLCPGLPGRNGASPQLQAALP